MKECKDEAREGLTILCCYPGMDGVDAQCCGREWCREFEKIKDENTSTRRQRRKNKIF